MQSSNPSTPDSINKMPFPTSPTKKSPDVVADADDDDDDDDAVSDDDDDDEDAKRKSSSPQIMILPLLEIKTGDCKFDDD